MTVHTSTVGLDDGTIQRLSAGLHRCFADLEADDDLFADDTFYDLLPPLWRFQLRGPASTFVAQLRSVADGPADVTVVRTIPTATGFVTEHVETRRAPSGVVTARRLHLCEVQDGRISAVTTYCNGGWDDALRARHAAEAPMIRA